MPLPHTLEAVEPDMATVLRVAHDMMGPEEAIMPATLTVPLPDDLLARIRQRAADTGTTPEAVAADALATVPQLQPKSGGFRRLAGTLVSDLTDASVRTDEYLTDGSHTDG